MIQDYILNLFSKGCTMTRYKKIRKACCHGKDELDFHQNLTLEECKVFCANESSCVSFEWKTNGEGCYASTTCQINDKTHCDDQDLFIKLCDKGVYLLVTILKKEIKDFLMHLKYHSE